METISWHYRLQGMTRLVLAAWVGAAALFVTTSVNEVRSPRLDSATKTVLADIRFPSYYQYGFTLVGIATICELIAGGKRVRWRNTVRALVIVTFALMVIDYVYVYCPLAELNLQPTRSPDFTKYHHLSRWINTLHVTLAAIAAILAR